MNMDKLTIFFLIIIGNVLCATEDVIKSYDELYKYESTSSNKLPGLFVDSMRNIDCQELADLETPRELCNIWINRTPNPFDPKIHIWCTNWSGAKH